MSTSGSAGEVPAVWAAAPVNHTQLGHATRRSCIRGSTGRVYRGVRPVRLSLVAPALLLLLLLLQGAGRWVRPQRQVSRPRRWLHWRRQRRRAQTPCRLLARVQLLLHLPILLFLMHPLLLHLPLMVLLSLLLLQLLNLLYSMLTLNMLLRKLQLYLIRLQRMLRMRLQLLRLHKCVLRLRPQRCLLGEEWVRQRRLKSAFIKEACGSVISCKRLRFGNVDLGKSVFIKVALGSNISCVYLLLHPSLLLLLHRRLHVLTRLCLMLQIRL
mmetsp:Transcript_34025/g.86060  ORF Transcript_34025/g.86060 Transcript_34025/m.86060 type:complete len:269 (-) Transcript_34025:141-947(-)